MGDELRNNNIFESRDNNITTDVINFANQMLNDYQGDDMGYPMMNMDEVPFMNNQMDDIDNIEMRNEDNNITDMFFE